MAGQDGAYLGLLGDIFGAILDQIVVRAGATNDHQFTAHGPT